MPEQDPGRPPEPSALDIEVEFRELVRALAVARVDYAVAGAFAVAIWGAPRATTDIDLLVRPEDADAVIAVARRRGFVFEALPMKFRDGLEIRRVTRLAGADVLTLDLLLVNASLAEAWQSRTPVHTEAGDVVVVSRDSLLKMKAAAGRPQDVGDIQRLTELDG